MDPSHPLFFLTLGTACLPGGDGAGELCAEGRLLGLFCTRQKAEAEADGVGAWNAAGPHDLPTRTPFFIPPSSLGSTRRALRWHPYQRSLRLGTVTPQLVSAGS